MSPSQFLFMKRCSALLQKCAILIRYVRYVHVVTCCNPFMLQLRESFETGEVNCHTSGDLKDDKQTNNFDDIDGPDTPNDPYVDMDIDDDMPSYSDKVDFL